MRYIVDSHTFRHCEEQTNNPTPSKKGCIAFTTEEARAYEAKVKEQIANFDFNAAQTAINAFYEQGFLVAPSDPLALIKTLTYFPAGTLESRDVHKWAQLNRSDELPYGVLHSIYEAAMKSCEYMVNLSRPDKDGNYIICIEDDSEDGAKEIEEKIGDLISKTYRTGSFSGTHNWFKVHGDVRTIETSQSGKGDSGKVDFLIGKRLVSGPQGIRRRIVGFDHSRTQTNVMYSENGKSQRSSKMVLNIRQEDLVSGSPDNIHTLSKEEWSRIVEAFGLQKHEKGSGPRKARRAAVRTKKLRIAKEGTLTLADLNLGNVPHLATAIEALKATDTYAPCFEDRMTTVGEQEWKSLLRVVLHLGRKDGLTYDQSLEVFETISHFNQGDAEVGRYEDRYNSGEDFDMPWSDIEDGLMVQLAYLDMEGELFLKSYFEVPEGITTLDIETQYVGQSLTLEMLEGKKHVILSCGTGSGKTTAVLGPDSVLRQEDVVFIPLTPTRALASTFSKFDLEAVCINSAHKKVQEAYEAKSKGKKVIITADECIQQFASVLPQGGTESGNQASWKEGWLELMELADVIVWMEKDIPVGFLSGLLEKLGVDFKPEETLLIRKPQAKLFEEVVFVADTCKNSHFRDWALPTIQENVSNGIITVIGCGSKAFPTGMTVKLRAEKYKVLNITADTVNNPEVKAFLSDPDGEASKYDVIMYNPAADSGLSLDAEGKYYYMGFQDHRSVTNRGWAQSMNRVRKPVNSTAHIWCNGLRNRDIALYSNATTEAFEAAVAHYEQMGVKMTVEVIDPIGEAILMMETFLRNYRQNQLNEVADMLEEVGTKVTIRIADYESEGESISEIGKEERRELIANAEDMTDAEHRALRGTDMSFEKRLSYDRYEVQLNSGKREITAEDVKDYGSTFTKKALEVYAAERRANDADILRRNKFVEEMKQTGNVKAFVSEHYMMLSLAKYLEPIIDYDKTFEDLDEEIGAFVMEAVESKAFSVKYLKQVGLLDKKRRKAQLVDKKNLIKAFKKVMRYLCVKVVSASKKIAGVKVTLHTFEENVELRAAVDRRHDLRKERDEFMFDNPFVTLVGDIPKLSEPVTAEKIEERINEAITEAIEESFYNTPDWTEEDFEELLDSF